MRGREAILNRIRNALAASRDDPLRQTRVDERIAAAPRGVIPARGQLDDKALASLFRTMADKAAATVARVDNAHNVPQAVTQYLRWKNLGAAVRRGDDPRLEAMPWSRQRSLLVTTGASDDGDEVGVSHALAAVAETGTVLLASGADNPTTINFLPRHHIVIVDAKDIVGDLESALARVRAAYGKGAMPRTLNLITGPSRSADIEQTIILGAHGPVGLHVIVIGG